MDPKIQVLLDNWKRRNINGIYCQNRDEAHNKILGVIPESSSIGFSGSQTLEQLEIVEMLESLRKPSKAAIRFGFDSLLLRMSRNA